MANKTDTLDELTGFLRRNFSIDLQEYKADFLSKKIEERMFALSYGDTDLYCKFLKENTSECIRLINSLGINVSEFFRNPEVFKELECTILPSVVANVNSVSDLRIWCAGCSHGEEAYSIAMLLYKYCHDHLRNLPPHPVIFASDIDSEALAYAVRGVYPKEALENLDSWNISYSVELGEQNFMMRPEIKSMIHFCYHNLASTTTLVPRESLFGGFDLILCRNVIIYFENDARKRILTKLVWALNKNGYLVLGKNESAFNIHAALVATDRRKKIYQKVS